VSTIANKVVLLMYSYLINGPKKTEYYLF